MIIKDCARHFVLKLYRHEASRGLFATAELLGFTKAVSSRNTFVGGTCAPPTALLVTSDKWGGTCFCPCLFVCLLARLLKQEGQLSLTNRAMLVCKVVEVWQDFLSEYVDKKFTYICYRRLITLEWIYYGSKNCVIYNSSKSPFSRTAAHINHSFLHLCRISAATRNFTLGKSHRRRAARSSRGFKMVLFTEPSEDLCQR